MELVELIEKMAPFGEGNLKPVLKIRIDTEDIVNIYAMGRDGLHARFLLNAEGYDINCVYFGGYQEIVAATQRGGRVDLLAVTEVNTFGGREEPRLNVKALPGLYTHIQNNV
jgi:single-stranded-DNA-specific exonuclease